MNIYQENILDHYKNPRRFGPLAGATATVEQANPLCGDRLQIEIKTDSGALQKFRFSGEGCAVSVAAASLLGELVEGRTLAEVLEISDKIMLEELGVPLSPTRTKCGLLALSGFRKALRETKA